MKHISRLGRILLAGIITTLAAPVPSARAADLALQPTYRAGVTPKLDVEWLHQAMNWTLETSRDIMDWAHVDAASYTRPQQGAFKATEDARVTDFYGLRKVGSPRLYVIGDSISTPTTWPAVLATLAGRHTFSQAIGGTTSSSMVSRTRGVELSYPLSNPVAPGTIHMKWRRHIADRTHNTSYRTSWAYYAKAVSEPTGIGVYQHGRFIGCAKRSLKTFTTSYASNSKTITCPGHGLAAGDQVTFIGNNPAYPSDLSVLDSTTIWNSSSPNLPRAIVERRVYFAANVTANTFEVKELSGDAATLNIGSNATGSPSIECGWALDVDYSGGAWDVTWTARTKYDDSIWLLEVSANDFPTYPVTTVTIPNTLLLLKQMIEINPRFILVCPPSGSYPDRGPGSFNWTNYYDTYLPWVRANYPSNHIDTMAVFDALRSAKEKSLLVNPAIPERLWIKGIPTIESSWAVYKVATADATETWVGPGYLPLKYRASFEDRIHPNSGGNQVIANAVSAMLTAKGW